MVSSQVWLILNSSKQFETRYRPFTNSFKLFLIKLFHNTCRGLSSSITRHPPFYQGLFILFYIFVTTIFRCRYPSLSFWLNSRSTWASSCSKLRILLSSFSVLIRPSSSSFRFFNFSISRSTLSVLPRYFSVFFPSCFFDTLSGSLPFSGILPGSLSPSVPGTY